MECLPWCVALVLQAQMCPIKILYHSVPSGHCLRMNSSYAKVKFKDGDTEEYLVALRLRGFLTECVKLAA